MRLTSRATQLVITCLVLGALAACGGGGSDGDDGAPGASTGTVQGVVENATSQAPIAGATVVVSPDPGGGSVTTDASGQYSMELPVGGYTVTYSAANFTTKAEVVSVLAAQTSVKDVALTPTKSVVVSAGSDKTANPGDTVALSVSISTLDGSSVMGIRWEQENSVPVTISSPTSASTNVVLPGLSVYKDELMHILAEPPISEADLPENIELPEEFPGGLQDRFIVAGINPFALEHAAAVALKVTVTTTSGTYSDEVEIHATLPWRPQASIRTVPINVPVLLHGKDQEDYSWSLTGPAGTSSQLDDASDQNPWFTPDIVGKYVATEAESGAKIEIYAGRWTGVITGIGSDGKPLATDCTFCHNDNPVPDKFKDWRLSGHAEIFTDSLNTNTHYGPNCFGCHTVGFDTGAANGGFDDAADYQDFLGAGLINNPGDNWTKVVTDHPATARMGNIQCENCHGPQSSTAHTLGAARVDLSSDVCATCHGEPLRHARYQQWQLSKHADYELAIEESQSSSCSRCHTSNGFLAWLPEAMNGNPDFQPDVTWTEDQAHPQTCVTCHDPHNPGSTTGSSTNATVRITGTTPPLAGGFVARGVGRGAICMTCHNGRRDLRNDVDYFKADSRETHGGPQADVVMGQNAYFVQVGNRSPHSYIEDACVKCHMVQTPPPDVLSYNLGGTNHTFAASRDICGDCHGEFRGEGLEEAVEGLMDDLLADLEKAFLGEIRTWVDDDEDVYVMDGSTILAVIDGTNVHTIRAPKASDDEEAAEEGFLTGSHGRQVVNIVIDGDVYHHVRIDSFKIGSSKGTSLIDGNTYGGSSLKDSTGASLTSGQTIAKAGWNWFLFHSDGSEGAHHPSFTLGALNASLEKLAEVMRYQVSDAD